jgi:hypothetical protein
MSVAQSTSTPSFLIVSERKSRLAREVSTSKTRFFLGDIPGGLLGWGIPEEILISRHPSLQEQGQRKPYPGLRPMPIVPDFGHDEHFDPYVCGEISPYRR